MDRETQKQRLLELFREHGGRLTLGQILETRYLAAAYRGRISDLREDGFSIECRAKRGDPTANLYVLKEPAAPGFLF